jgi:DNA-binding Lrp family transcriptional regulator
MSNKENKIIRKEISILQDPLSLESQPFANYAKRLSISENEVIELLKKYVDQGVIRRVAGILKHDLAGFTTNAMVVFEVEDSECDRVGNTLAEFAFISHCYRRATYPDWPYNVYAMVHANDISDFNSKLSLIKQKIVSKSMLVLSSVKEYKKTSFRLQDTNR